MYYPRRTLADVFISYSRSDKAAANALAALLKNEGWSVWMDTGTLPGEAWDKAIERELDEAGCVLVLWSSIATESTWVRSEARRAMRADKLVPVRIDPVRLPIEFDGLHTVDLLNWSYDAGHPAILPIFAGVKRALGQSSIRTRVGLDDVQLIPEESLRVLCREQVTAEITAMIGRKYLPDLYVQTNAANRLDVLLNPSRYRDGLLAALSEQSANTYRTLLNTALQKWAYWDIVELLQELQGNTRPITNPGSLLHFLIANGSRLRPGSMIVLAGRAGIGKTTILCRLATTCGVDDYPLFLTGRSGVTERTSILELLEARLRRRCPASLVPKDGLLGRLFASAKREKRRVVIFLDAINEHRDLDIANASIAQFLADTRDEPVILVCACRDIYWPFFSANDWPEDQWLNPDFGVEPFQASAREAAITAYFTFYNIQADVTDAAKEKLAHPLLLRFFCEAYGNPDGDSPQFAGEVRDIRLKPLFETYLKRKLDSVRLLAPGRRRSALEAEQLIFGMAERMRQSKRREVKRSEVNSLMPSLDVEAAEGVYVALLGEELIIEEQPSDDPRERNVVFCYEEFLAYVIARAMLEGVADRLAAAAVLSECVRNLQAFPLYAGIIQYIGVIVREELNLSIWNDVDAAARSVARAIVDGIEKMDPRQIGKAELDALFPLAKLPDLRRDIVGLSKRVILETVSDPSIRSIAADLLADILQIELDPNVRVLAVRCFEGETVRQLGRRPARIAEWWRGVRQRGVLLSDDETGVLEILSIYLANASPSLRVSCETDPEVTLAKVMSLRPALLITDEAKGGRMTGTEMARRLPEDPDLAGMKVLMLSGYPVNESSALFSKVLQKPITADEFVAAVLGLLCSEIPEEVLV